MQVCNSCQDPLRERQASLMIFLQDLGKADPFKDLQKMFDQMEKYMQIFHSFCIDP